jgi:MoxR-like ATPase
LKRYIVDLVQATRRPAEYGLKSLTSYIQYGASPRGTIFLSRAARAQAFLVGRDYVVTDDIKQLGPDVLRHRIGLTYEAEAEEVTAENILQQVFDTLKVP